MIEKIGNVVLNFKHYPGEDLYSDGLIEDELLEISKKYKQNEWNQVIADRCSWPILYHFSHIRQNITDWLPITKDETVLEIGSGCGAITGNLAKKAKKVTCIELSKKRTLINANRNKEYDNIEILVGNFQDVEKDLTERYDYITLIGVFEYSAGYIGTDSPYTKMLQIISRHLKPNGKLIIAIENRLGMKYWSGCTEDHVGTYFEGIEGYPNTTSVKTFSKKEWDQLFDAVGIYKYQMYYPYPDYKFPMDIYSDKWLPEVGELKNNEYNFDRKRLRLFDETRTYNSVITNDLYPVFSNSFLIVASLKEAKDDENYSIYVKYSNERCDDFSQRTHVMEDTKGQRSVYKYSVTEEGKQHMVDIYQRMQSLEDLYKDTCIQVNKCWKNKEGIELEYLEGTTLEQILDEFVEKKEYEEVWNLLERYFSVLRSVSNTPFVKTQTFTELFGDLDLPAGLLCPAINNIDAICPNIIWGEKEWKMLDYEWSFAIPIPVNYQIYRVLFYYLCSSVARSTLLPLDFYKRAGLTEEELLLYRQMELNFQEYIRRNKTPMSAMYTDISPGVLLNVKEAHERDHGKNPMKAQIYYDRGEDFSEGDSVLADVKDLEYAQIEVPVSGNEMRVRIDPCDEKCIVEVLMLSTKPDGDEILPYSCNGERLKNHMYLFDTMDPYLILDMPKDCGRKLYLKFHIHRFGMQDITELKEEILGTKRMLDHFRAELEAVNQEKEALIGERTHLQQAVGQTMSELEALRCELGRVTCELQQAHALIQDMRNTKIWRFYETVKGKK